MSKQNDQFGKLYSLLVPLLDALEWYGSEDKILEAIDEVGGVNTADDIIDTMASLKFVHKKIDYITGTEIDERVLPILLKKNSEFYVVVAVEGHDAVVYSYNDETFVHTKVNKLNGTAHIFEHVDEIVDDLVTPQNNWFNKFMARFKESFIALIFTTFILTLLDLFIPLFVILIYGQIGRGGSEEAFIVTFIGIVLYIASGFSLGLIRSKIINYISIRMRSVISLNTYTRLLYLSPSYTETASISSQISRMKDFENISRFVKSGIFVNLLEIAFSILYIITIFAIAGWVGIVPIVTMFIVIGIGLLMRPAYLLKMEKVSETSAAHQQNLLEILRNTDEIKASRERAFWIKRYKKLASNVVYNRYRLSDYTVLTNSISYFITNVSVIVVIYGSVLKIFSGDMNLGSLIGVLLLYWRVVASIRGAFSLSVQVNGILKSIGQINRFMKLPLDHSLKKRLASQKRVKGQVRFKGVSIRYTNNAAPALVNVNFDAQPGEVLALFGHDGSGRTTVLKLILSMYTPQAGRILLDGTNIRQFEPLSLRQSISYAPGKDDIFVGTVRENFKHFNLEISDEEIEVLLRQTGVDKYMERLGFTLDTFIDRKTISETSMSFKKLFNITRMLARDVKLYLVDEPENYLHAEEVIQVSKMLKEVANQRGATMIIATKSNDVLKVCDKIIRLNQGRIVNR